MPTPPTHPIRRSSSARPAAPPRRPAGRSKRSAPAAPVPAVASSASPKVVALGGLAGVVCVTSGLLLALAPAPLSPTTGRVTGGNPPSASAVMTTPLAPSRRIPADSGRPGVPPIGTAPSRGGFRLD